MSIVAIAGQTFRLRVELESQAAAGTFQSSPTVAAGDVKLLVLPASPTGSETFANSTNAPSALNGPTAEVIIAAAETTAAGDGGEIIAVWADAAGAEWYSLSVHLQVKAAEIATQTNITAGTIATVTNGVTLAGTQPAVTFGQVKIVADVANEGALDIVNSNDDGIGQRNYGAHTGARNEGVFYGLRNIGGLFAFVPVSASASDVAGVQSTVNSILEDTGTTLPAQIALISGGAGSGAISFPVTIYDEDSNPIDGVEVWISTDSAGASVVAGTLSTDALGVATFMLDAGTYYLWRQKSGYNFTNPVTIVVS